MTISIGDRIPDCMLSHMSEQGPQPLKTSDYFAARKIVLFSVPGAFTPTCSAYHLPGFVEHMSEFTSLGVDAIACVSVNDVFVMHAWGKSVDANGVDMLADGNAEFAEAIGLDSDASAFGMGKRSKRFALVANDGVVTHLMIEAPGEFRVSSAEHVLSILKDD
jgi:peroxiredoxin